MQYPDTLYCIHSDLELLQLPLRHFCCILSTKHVTVYDFNNNIVVINFKQLPMTRLHHQGCPSRDLTDDLLNLQYLLFSISILKTEIKASVLSCCILSNADQEVRTGMIVEK